MYRVDGLFAMLVRGASKKKRSLSFVFFFHSLPTFRFQISKTTFVLSQCNDVGMVTTLNRMTRKNLCTVAILREFFKTDSKGGWRDGSRKKPIKMLLSHLAPALILWFTRLTMNTNYICHIIIRAKKEEKPNQMGNKVKLGD